MPNLGEVYEHRDADGRRGVIALGLTAFFAGIALLLSGILVATTPLADALALDTYAARRVAGVLAGVAVPTMFVGIVTVLPTSTRARLKVGIGVFVALLGVALFWAIYPEQWITWADDHRTFEVVASYALGSFVGLWYVLDAVATFKQRNDPKGTVTLEVTRDGETRTIEVDQEELSQRGVEDIIAERTED
jgi:hypothetical protein